MIEEETPCLPPPPPRKKQEKTKTYFTFRPVLTGNEIHLPKQVVQI